MMDDKTFEVGELLEVHAQPGLHPYLVIERPTKESRKWVIVYLNEVCNLITALTEAAAWLAVESVDGKVEE